MLEKLEESKEHYARALAINPEDPRAYIGPSTISSLSLFLSRSFYLRVKVRF
jgi:hypothetical protein